MTRLQFLCVNHRRWIIENPDVALRTWMQAYSRSIELLDDYHHLQAAQHAGAAYEIADIMLAHVTQPNAVDICRFCDSGLLLVQLLYLIDEAQLAATVMASALARLEGLLTAGGNRRAIMSGCQRLQQFAHCPPKGALKGNAPEATVNSRASAQVH